MNDVEIEIQLVLTNKFGEFLGKKTMVDGEKYRNILVITKSFYEDGGFELTCEDGSFVVFPPEIVRQSILQVKKITKEDVQK